MPVRLTAPAAVPDDVGTGVGCAEEFNPEQALIKSIPMLEVANLNVARRVRDTDMQLQVKTERSVELAGFTAEEGEQRIMDLRTQTSIAELILQSIVSSFGRCA